MSQSPLPSDETLSQALKRLDQTKWQHMRSGKVLYSQATQACQTIASIRQDGRWLDIPVKEAHRYITDATGRWYAHGVSPATINKRLSCLKQLGVDFGDAASGVKVPNKLKWWLKPQQLDVIMASSTPQWVKEYIQWTLFTGLRVEETLALTLADFGEGFRSVTVPGTKTSGSQATLPLGAEASRIAISRSVLMLDNGRMFTATYEQLQTEWDKARALIGAAGVPGATLKSLRRTAARYLHVTKGMPLDMVREYLRHEDVKTTQGYLRLTGGYDTEEMRRFL